MPLDLLILMYCIRFAFGQGVSTITFSKVPVYTGEDVTLTCSLAANEGLILTVTLVAVSETREVGTLFCDPSRGNAFRNSGEDRFAGLSFTAGCEESTVKSPSVVVRASLSWELHYSCTFAVFITGSSTVRNVTSASVRLSVWVLPTAPSLFPSSLIFNEADSIVLECNSWHGTPVADIDFIAVQQKSGHCQRISGSSAVALRLPGATMDWYNAEVTCRVVNHNIPNMTIRGVIRVNHIAARHGSPLMVNTYSSSRRLDCSEHVISFPHPSYTWWQPGDTYMDTLPHFNSAVLTVPQGRSGFYVCIAANNATGRSVVTTYRVTNVLQNAEELIEWLIPVLCLLVVGLSVAIAVLYKRTHLNRREAAGLRIQKESQGSCGTDMLPVQRKVATKKRQPEDCQYQSLNLETINEHGYAQFAAVPQTSDTAAYEDFQS